MRASIIAVGSELLGTTRLDTNSLKLTRMLEKYGVGVARKCVVGDVQSAIADELRFSLDHAEVVLITGGLGPTEDDLTKDAVAEALSLKLETDDAVLQRIAELFAARGYKMAATNAKQALVFAGQKTIGNQRGTAPGFHINVVWNGAPRHIWIFPGVPHELEGMIERDLEPWLRETRPSGSRHHRVVKVTGMAESAVDEKLKPFYAKHPGEPVGILASHGEIQIHLQCDGAPDEAYARLVALEAELREIYGERIFGLDDETLESVVGKLLASRGETIATAESCTGGLLGSRITDVSGSSAYYLGGVVVYSRDAKLFLLGVDPKAIEDHGEVSEEVSREMAIGARRRFGTTYGVGITGIAGPTGGTEAKPVGTVHIAAANAARCEHRKAMFHGSREMVKWWSTQAALDMVRVMMLRGVPGSGFRVER